jgi:hypothetical protein
MVKKNLKHFKKNRNGEIESFNFDEKENKIYRNQPSSLN